MTTREHTVTQFDTDLDAVRSRALAMGGLVEQQIRRALDAFTTGNLQTAASVIEEDRRVDAMEVGIDEECTAIIARRHPTASDLRLLITIGKIITDLERVGDEAEKVARMVQLIYAAERSQAIPHIEIRHMAKLALDMLEQSLAAFARVDTVAAAEVARQDCQVNDEYRAILRQLLTIMMGDARSITHCLEILFAAKALERIGDHAKNIAEYVIYLVNGKDVRHARAEQIEREGSNRH